VEAQSRPVSNIPVYRLIYASRIAPVCQEDLRKALLDIVGEAISNNRKTEVTGLLVAHRGWFVQALEGEEETVAALYRRISADRRHHHVQSLSGEIAEARLFSWSMGARVLASGDEAVLMSLNPKAQFDPTRAQQRTILRLLTTVADVHWRMLGEQQSLAA